MFQKAPLYNIPIARYFISMSAIADTLGTMAQKELRRTPLTEAERLFLKTMLYETPAVCTKEFRGWYSRLYYTGESGLMRKDLTVADVHTAPTDESGAPVGWVLHAGTGPLNLAIVAAALPDGKTTAFIGPVLSYYEHVSTNFKRLTDEEWKKAYAVAPSFRPSFIRLYLADSTGSSHNDVQSLLTGVDDNPFKGMLPSTIVLAQNYPNPFNSSTVIMFSIPEAYSGTPVSLAIFDIQGRLVKRLLNSQLPAGNYAARWDGTNVNGVVAASGVYFYHLVAGGQRAIGRMALVK
jgi:hypothetical protein